MTVQTLQDERRIVRSIHAYRGQLLSLLMRCGLGAGDAEDVVQEAFWVLARRITDVPERAERSFLIGTALRLASDRRRSAWYSVMACDRRVEAEHVPALSPEALQLSPEALQHRRDARRRVEAALRTLRADERIVFVLIELEGLSRRETAHLLHARPGTVASRYARARARLEEALGAPSLDQGLARNGFAFHETAPELVVGARRYLMNPWGEHKARGSFEQCFIERQQDGRLQNGWYWYWPGLDRSVFAYPEVVIGWKPWLGGASTDARLPVKVAAASTLVVDYGVEMRATGSYNLALSTWLTRFEGGTTLARPESITTELMVWPCSSPGVVPLGTFVCDVVCCGIPHELWRAERSGRRFPGDRNGWTVLTLRGMKESVAGRLPLGEILMALVNRRFVEASDYVSCVELGNEVMGGAGTTFVEKFAVDL